MMASIAPVAQPDRATGFEPVGRGFESLRARQNRSANAVVRLEVASLKLVTLRVKNGRVIPGYVDSEPVQNVAS